MLIKTDCGLNMQYEFYFGLLQHDNKLSTTPS